MEHCLLKTGISNHFSHCQLSKGIPQFMDIIYCHDSSNILNLASQIFCYCAVQLVNLDNKLNGIDGFTLCSDQQSGSHWPITKRSPSRRRSRWEPVADENLNDKLGSADDNATKNLSLVQVEAAEKVVFYSNDHKTTIGGTTYKPLVTVVITL